MKEGMSLSQQTIWTVMAVPVIVPAVVRVMRVRRAVSGRLRTRSAPQTTHSSDVYYEAIILRAENHKLSDKRANE